MAQTVSSFDAALKEFYLPRLLSTVNKGRVLSEHLRRDTSLTDVSGRRAVVPVNIRPSEAVGARGDNSALPTPLQQTFVEVRMGYAYNYATVRITHPTIVSSKNDRGAFVRAVGAEFDGIRRDLKNDVNRQWFGDGSGFLGRANGAGAATTALVMDADIRVKVNMRLDAWDTKAAAGTQTLDGAVASSVSGTTVTLSATDTWSDNDFIFRENAANNEMMGLLGIADGGQASTGADGAYVTTLFNVSRTTYPEWRARVSHNTGTPRAITEAILDTAILDVQSASEGDPSLIISNATQFRKGAALLTGDRRYTPSMTLSGGFKALDWAGIPWVWDRDCPIDSGGDAMIFILDMDDLMILQLQDWDFDDTDGSVLHRVSGFNYYDATLFFYGQFGCTAPDDQAVIRDLNNS